MDNRPQRKTPAHHPLLITGNRTLIVFLTVCTSARKPILACGDIHDIVRTAWERADRWAVGRYVVMPDHVHLFCSPSSPDAPPLAEWVTYWKSLVSSSWPRTEEKPIWQKSFWDTQLRESDGYSAKWEYVRANPVRAGLCADADEWPYAGEIHSLEWHDR